MSLYIYIYVCVCVCVCELSLCVHSFSEVLVNNKADWVSLALAKQTVKQKGKSDFKSAVLHLKIKC